MVGVRDGNTDLIQTPKLCWSPVRFPDKIFFNLIFSPKLWRGANTVRVRVACALFLHLPVILASSASVSRSFDGTPAPSRRSPPSRCRPYHGPSRWSTSAVGVMRCGVVAFAPFFLSSPSQQQPTPLSPLLQQSQRRFLGAAIAIISVSISIQSFTVFFTVAVAPIVVSRFRIC